MRIKRSFKVVMGPRTRYEKIWNKWLNPKGIEEQWGISAYLRKNKKIKRSKDKI